MHVAEPLLLLLLLLLIVIVVSLKRFLGGDDDVMVMFEGYVHAYNFCFCLFVFCLYGCLGCSICDGHESSLKYVTSLS